MRNYRHSQWDVEHVLMALLSLKDGLPTHILLELGINADAVKARLHQLLESGPKVAVTDGQIYSTPRSVAMVANAKREADRLKDEYVGVEHLFIAAVMETQGNSAQVVKEFGID